MNVAMLMQEDVLTAVLAGDIDHHSAKEMREAIDAQVERDKPRLLQLDFQQVDFMDSSGIGLIMGRYKLMQLMGGQVRVIHVPAYIKRVIRLSGLDQLGVLEKDLEKDVKKDESK